MFLIFGRIWMIFRFAIKNGLYSYRATTSGSHIRLSPPLRLRYFFEDCGGVFFKLGQILAMRFDVLPITYAVALNELFDKVSPIPNELMFEVFKDEIGAGIDTYFDIGKKPIASASFAQVYRGRFRGEDVAIKIQKPNVEKYIKADLALLRGLFTVLKPFGILNVVKLEEVINQLKEWLVDELDYRREAHNTAIIYSHISQHSLEEQIIVPRMYETFTQRRVLVQTYVPGLTLSQILRGDQNTLEQKNIEKILLSFKSDIHIATNLFIRDLMRQYFVDGFFQADPHPGNLMILPGNKIGFLDFGIVGKSVSTTNYFCEFIYGAANLEYKKAAHGLVQFAAERVHSELGQENIGDKKMRDILEETLTFLERQFERELPSIIGNWHFSTGDTSLDINKRSSSIAFFKIVRLVEKYGLRLPSDVIAFIRTLLIVDMVCLRLSPKFNMVKAIHSFFDVFPLASITALKTSHAHELHTLQTLQSLQEDSLESTMIRKEQHLLAKEKLMDRIYALAERNPELYTTLKRYK